MTTRTVYAATAQPAVESHEYTELGSSLRGQANGPFLPSRLHILQQPAYPSHTHHSVHSRCTSHRLSCCSPAGHAHQLPRTPRAIRRRSPSRGKSSLNIRVAILRSIQPSSLPYPRRSIDRQARTPCLIAAECIITSKEHWVWDQAPAPARVRPAGGMEEVMAPPHHLEAPGPPPRQVIGRAARLLLQLQHRSELGQIGRQRAWKSVSPPSER